MSHVISRNLRLIGLTLSIIRTSYPLGQQTRPSYQELNNEERSVTNTLILISYTILLQ